MPHCDCPIDVRAHFVPWVVWIETGGDINGSAIGALAFKRFFAAPERLALPKKDRFK